MALRLSSNDSSPNQNDDRTAEDEQQRMDSMVLREPSFEELEEELHELQQLTVRLDYNSKWTDYLLLAFLIVDRPFL